MHARKLLACVTAAATAGFLIWNYPRGMLFAGDGGAYVWGLTIALASLLPVRALLYTLSDDAIWLFAVQGLEGVSTGLYSATKPLVIADLMRTRPATTSPWG